MLSWVGFFIDIKINNLFTYFHPINTPIKHDLISPFSLPKMVRNFRKPLVIVGPKGMLRLAQVTSDLSEVGPGTHFINVISDPEVNSDDVKKVIVC